MEKQKSRCLGGVGRDRSARETRASQQLSSLFLFPLRKLPKASITISMARVLTELLLRKPAFSLTDNLSELGQLTQQGRGISLSTSSPPFLESSDTVAMGFLEPAGERKPLPTTSNRLMEELPDTAQFFSHARLQ